MTVGIIGTFNQADECTLTGGNWTTGKPLSNLRTTRVTQTARAAALTRSSTCFKLSGGQMPFRVLALLNHNLTPTPVEWAQSPAVAVRIRTIRGAGSIPPPAATFNLRASPASIVASANLVGTLPIIQAADEEDAPGAVLTATVPGSDTVLRCDWEVTSSTYLASGANLQTFRIFCQRTGVGGSNPTLTVELWQSGALVATLLSGHAVSAPGLVDVSWDAALLAGSPVAASTVQIRVRGISTGTATVEFGPLKFIQEITDGPTAVVTDSGWLTPPLPPNYWQPPTPLRRLAFRYVRDQSTDWDEIWVDIEANTNTAGFVDIGRLVVTDAMPFYWVTGNEADPSFGLMVTPVDPSLRERMGDGTLETERYANWLEMELQFSSLNQATAFESVLGLYAQQGTTGDMLWLPWPDDDAAPFIWGPLKECRPLTIRGNNWWEVPFVVESR
jgi:hypothetical protein